ncbi:AAA family ATPase [Luteolibacter sp. Populi]|uniref:AAA family ATPase n=1 Tax=Luteolibacter sp. Populi TaxID=3230487 RepID=UPI0034676804
MNEATIADMARRLGSEVLEPLKKAYVGKDEIIDLMGVSLAARENLFLYGPPGTAKSALVHSLAARIHGHTFDYLLSRFTEPNELFGPFDIRRLREGDLVTNTEGMLPEADIVFLDELLNANSAILNSLLMALNERIFRRGRETRAIPALFFAGASNHLPEDDALRALFDRFLLRVRCGPVAESQLARVLAAGWDLEKKDGESAATLTAGDLREFQKAVRVVDLSPVREAYLDLVIKLRHAGMDISDRRAVRLQRVIAASALLCGRLEARVSDLWVLRHVWDREEQIEVIESIVGAVLAAKHADAGDHPQAHANRVPDPDVLAAGLEDVASRLAADPADAAAADELRVLASRLDWLPAGVAKDDLLRRTEALWQKIAL